MFHVKDIMCNNSSLKDFNEELTLHWSGLRLNILLTCVLTLSRMSNPDFIQGKCLFPFGRFLFVSYPLVHNLIRDDHLHLQLWWRQQLPWPLAASHCHQTRSLVLIFWLWDCQIIWLILFFYHLYIFINTFLAPCSVGHVEWACPQRSRHWLWKKKCLKVQKMKTQIVVNPETRTKWGFSWRKMQSTLLEAGKWDTCIQSTKRLLLRHSLWQTQP